MIAGLFPYTARTTTQGHLIVGDVDLCDLADRVGTPFVLFDRVSLEERVSAYCSALPPECVLYAGKAFLSVALCELLDGLGVGLDVCSGGELATAVRAGFPSQRILFHGNNKSFEEMVAARDAGVGRVVVDCFEEAELLERVGVQAKLLVRVTPGVEAHAHEYVQTGKEDSKFGFSLAEGTALDAIRTVAGVPGCDFVGLHAHVGSQMFELDALELAIARLAELARSARDHLGISVSELNVGGGIGIAHTSREAQPDLAQSAARLVSETGSYFAAHDLPQPAVFVEPGRSLVGPCGVSVYRVGVVKRISGVRTYVSVDGGMSDNIRPALYGAKYEAHLANRMHAPHDMAGTVVGKHCESGDILIQDALLPSDIAPGDLLCIPATGAYTYSMASTYNRVPRPPVIMASKGRTTTIVKRETTEDLLRLDCRLDGSLAAQP
ncbi:MAG: diaminopimelate decarboxylase [Actinomycetota bacterium]|nr:diaminopimelate decarboxylase [Actinomycetota bacterium]